MGEEGEEGGEEIVMEPAEVVIPPSPPKDKNKVYVAKMLDGCLKITFVNITLGATASAMHR